MIYEAPIPGQPAPLPWAPVYDEVSAMQLETLEDWKENMANNLLFVEEVAELPAGLSLPLEAKLFRWRGEEDQEWTLVAVAEFTGEV